MGGCASTPKDLKSEAEAPVRLEEPPVAAATAATAKAEKPEDAFRKSLGVLFTENEEGSKLCESEDKDTATTPELKLEAEAEPPKLQEHPTEDLEAKAEPPKVQEHSTAEALEPKAEPTELQEHPTEIHEPKPETEPPAAAEAPDQPNAEPPKSPEHPTEVLERKAETPMVQEQSSDEKSAELGAKAEVQAVEEVAVAATKKKEGVASFFLRQIMVKNFLVKPN